MSLEELKLLVQRGGGGQAYHFSFMRKVVVGSMHCTTTIGIELNRTEQTTTFVR